MVGWRSATQTASRVSERERGEYPMLSFRNIVAVAVFLFGTTFLWMTPLFIGPRATGAIWTAAQVLGFVAILGFTVAAWGIFKATGWWETVALASAVAGVAATIP